MKKPNKQTVAALRELEQRKGKAFKTTKELFKDWKKLGLDASR